MFEKYLIDHCAPTLASLKTGSLFNLPLSEADDLPEQTQRWNRELGEKGITLYILRFCNRGALVYVCRTSRLEKELTKPEVQRFLSGYGYRAFGTDYAVERLKQRLCTEDSFPHEIGIFLGYPLEDVKGFIENAGKTPSVPDAGRYITTNVKQSGHSSNIKMQGCVCPPVDAGNQCPAAHSACLK